MAVGAFAAIPEIAVAEERPFRAEIEANAHLSDTEVPWIKRNDESGEGHATHLGRFTWADIEFADFSTPGEVHVVATFTMTAADGDQLYGEFTTVGNFPDPGTLVIHGIFRFTGGTGRFAYATGGGKLDAIGLLTEGLPVAGTMNGTINY